MKNKWIILGEAKVKKPHKVLKKVTKNKGTTIIVNAYADKDYYIHDYPKLKNFEVPDKTKRKDTYIFESNRKYYIYVHDNPSEKKEIINDLIEDILTQQIFNKRSTLIVFDDSSWNFVSNKFKTLWKISKLKCKIMILENNMKNVLGKPKWHFPKTLFQEIEKRWHIITEKRSSSSHG